MLIFFIFILLIQFQAGISQNNLSLAGRKTYSEDLSDVWGYAANGKEYALVGVRSGVSIVDVTAPATPSQLFFVTTAASDWHDIDTWNGYAYVTNETGGGLTIIDLNFLPDSIKIYTWNGGIGLSTAHTVFADENGVIYVAGGNATAGRGVIMMDADANATAPPLLGKYNVHYVHDVFVRNDTMWTAEINDGIFAVVDISNKNSPVVLATNNTPNNLTHNVWLSDNGMTLLTTDEVNNAYITSYDVTDLGNIRQLDLFQFNPGTNSLPHNVHYVNDFAVASYYRDGVVIIDASDPENLIAVGNYDTSPLSGGGYNGCWSVYPYLPSGNILASDIEQGLFVLVPNYQKACYLEGIITDRITGQRIHNASVKILPSNPAEFTNLTGEYKTGIAASGIYSVEFSKTGYVTHIENSVSLTNGATVTLNVQLIPMLNVTLTGSVLDSTGSGGISGAIVMLKSSFNSYTATTDSLGKFTIDSFETGVYSAYAGTWGYVTRQFSLMVLSDTSVHFHLHKGYYDDFLFDFGWTQSSSASSGAWVRDEPVGTTYNSQPSNPDTDVSNDFGNQCYVTGNTGGQPSIDDVDDGSVKLISPVFDLSGYFDPYLLYSRWFFNAGGSGSPDDTLTVSLSNGSDTAVIDALTAATGTNAWHEIQIRVNDFLTSSADMSLIFETGDNAATAHLVEAAIDLFFVFDSLYPPAIHFISDKNESCPGDTIRMTDQTLYHPISWLWEFPGGIPATSTEQNPQVVYLTPGTYDVKLSATNAGGTSSIIKQSFIIVNQPPTIHSSMTQASSGIDNDGSISVSITGNSPFNITWSDGSSDTILQNLFPGDYSLTVTDSLGCKEADTITVTAAIVQLPEADFTSDKTEGCPGDTFSFSDLTTNHPDSLFWEFPGGNPPTSTGSHPLVAYENSGMYSVTLTAINAAGSDLVIKSSYIKINVPPTLQVVVTNATSANSSDGAINVQASGSAPFLYQWSNGDTTARAQNLTPGDYSITVTDSNECRDSATIAVRFFTAIPTNDNDVTVYCFPNPFSNSLEINSNNTVDLSFFNSIGRELNRTKLNPGDKINWGVNQQPGIYFVLISQGAESKNIIKLIKTK